MKRTIAQLLIILLWISAAVFAAAAETSDEPGDYLARGKLYYNRADYKQALRAFETALEGARERRDDRDTADALYRIGMTFGKLGDYRGALPSLEESLTIYRRIGDTWGMAECEFEMGYSFYFEREYDRALIHFEEMLRLFTEIGSEVGKGIAMSNIGMVLIEQGDLSGSAARYGEALSVFRDTGNDRLAVGALKGIARVHARRQEYEQELAALTEALKIAERIGDAAEEAALLAAVGMDWAMLGQYETAIEFHDRSLTIFRTLGDKTGEGYALVHTGSGLNNLGRYQEGLERYTKAREIFREIGDPVGAGYASAGMAFSHHEMGHNLRSLFLFSHVLRLAEREKDNAEIAEDPLIRGMIAAGMERYRRAIGPLETALADGTAKSDPVRIGYAAGYLGYCYKALGNYGKAVEYYATAIDVLERIRGDIRQDTYKTSFMKSKIEVYEDIVEMLIKLGRFEEAFDYMERARSRALLDLLGGGRIDVRGARERELLGREKDLADRLSRLSAAGTEDGAGNRSESGSRSEELHEATGEYDELVKEMAGENPELASLVAVSPLALADVQSILAADTRIIEYFTTADALYIFSVGTDDFLVRTVSIGRQELSEKVSDLREAIKVTLGSADVSGITDSSRELYDALVAPVLPIDDGERLIIIPHGPLHYLPFGALYDGKQYLIERYTLVFDPSASVLRYIIEKRKEPGETVIAFGNPTTKYNPLPFAEREVEDIRSIMKRADIYRGGRATETRGRRSFKDFSIIHLACHGVFDQDDPLSSALFLAPDAQNDGTLKVGELFGLDLEGSSLVVLSACETGLSRVTKGDELIGLSRGFIFAGTPSLVVTLWEVADDSTAALMAEFYRSLSAGTDKPQSLRRAVLWLLSQPGYEHPFYWAPFVMIGDWR